MNLFQKLCGVKDLYGKRVEDEKLRALYAQSLRIAGPAAVEGALMSIISAIDTMMVGTLGPAAIAAVGLTAQPRLILLIAAQSLCVGTTALCARRKGADNREGANACLSQSMMLVTLLGLAVTLIGTVWAEGFMRLAGANEETIGMSADYFRIISLGMLPNCWSLCICAAMRGIGKTRVTMVTNIAANVVNVCLNYVLIGGKLGFPKLGVRGAAIATAIGTAAGCVIAFGFVLRREGYLCLRASKFDRLTLQGLTSVGASSVLEAVALRLGFLINARMIAGIGTVAFATYQISSHVTNLSFTLGDGISVAGMSLVGQSLGAKEKNLAMIHVRIARRLSVFAALLLMAAIFLLRRPLALLFTTEEEIISGVALSFYVVLAGLLAQNGRVIYSGCLRGAGDTKFVAKVVLLSVTLLRPLLTYLISYPLDRILPGLQLAMIGAWIAFDIDAYVRVALLYRRIQQGKWMDIKLA